MIKILICDDQELVCEGLKAILSTDPNLDIVGVANDGAEALELIPDCQPDLILMDLKMPVMNGIQATRQIRQQYAGIQILVLTTYDADNWVCDAIRGGAGCYLLKFAPGEHLFWQTTVVFSGKSPVDPDVA